MPASAVKIDKPINVIGPVKAFTVMGDPGCDGMGVEIMTTFAKALNCTHGDFKIILGDLVPFGLEHFYQHISNIINDISPNPVYSLCGNHDTEHYVPYFGRKDYVLVNDDILIVVLDNSRKKFEVATLDFLASSLKEYRRRNILVLFHVPPVTRFSSNGMKPAEWERLREVMDPYRADIRYILCGHVHSYFEDERDGYTIVVSGGGGARLEFLGGLPDKDHSFHHVLQFSFNAQGLLQYQYVSLANVDYAREAGHDKVKLILEKGFQFEAAAHARYQFLAEDAYEKGFPGMARLFRAYARSAYYHARNYFSVLNKMRGITENLGDSLALENGELDVLMTSSMPQTHEGVTPLAYYAFYEAHEAKKKNIELLPEAINAYEAGEDIGTQSYFVCTTCGNMRSADEPPDHCHICGAPPDKIVKI